MSNPNDPRLDAFLDDQMNPSGRDAFADLLDQDANLRAKFVQQRAIDSSLRRLYGQQQLEKLLEVIEASLVQNPGGAGRFRTAFRGWRALSAAALVAISLGGLWYSWRITQPSPVVDPYAPQPWRSFATVYHDTIQDGFKPAWICRNERQFERAFSRRFKQPLLLAALPSGITAGGISYSNTISEATINVLGKVEGAPVMIFVDKRTADAGPPPPPPPDLHLFRREIDELVLYELTPFDRPNILPYFYNPRKN